MINSIPRPASLLLQCYFPEVRYLKAFSMSKDIGTGYFRVSDPLYCQIEGLEHLTATELQLCLNQMLYCFFDANGALASFNDYRSYNSKHLAQWQAIKTFIIEQDFRFHRKIPITKSFSARMQLCRFRKSEKMCLALVKFDFADGACTGKLKVALVR